MPVAMGHRVHAMDGAQGSTVFGGRGIPFFMCGLCMTYWSNVKSNICSHIENQTCKTLVPHGEKEVEAMREQSRLRGLRYRERARQDAALTNPEKKRRRQDGSPESPIDTSNKTNDLVRFAPSDQKTQDSDSVLPVAEGR